MYSSSSVKTPMEGIHLDYLCQEFGLERTTGHDIGIKVDLISIDDSCLFEVKTRIYPRTQHTKEQKPISSFAWWSPDEKQIQRYEEYVKKNNLELFWLFLLGHTEKQATDLEDLNEEAIKHREIYVFPWEAYKLVNLTQANNRHLGLARLKRNHKLTKQEVKKGELFIAESITDRVSKYFT